MINNIMPLKRKRCKNSEDDSDLSDSSVQNIQPKHKKELSRIHMMYLKEKICMNDVINRGLPDEELLWYYRSFERMKDLVGSDRHDMEDRIRRRYETYISIKNNNLQLTDTTNMIRDPIAKISKSNHSVQTKNILISRILGCLDNSGNSEEYQKTLNWVDWILHIPTTVRASEQSIENILNRLWERMNTEMSCMKEVMLSIMQAVCMMRCDTDKSGSVLTLVGPPGCGKTTLCSILASAIGMGFGHVSCGSIKDQAVVMGHSSTYIGAKPGIFTQILVNNQQLDNVILLDEMDKLPDTQILPILLHVLDRTQNNRFHDMFCPEIDIDLSKNLFCIAVNTLDNFDSALLDRMKIIYLPGYDKQQKKEIIIRHTIPKLEHRTGIQVKITDKTIDYLIDRLNIDKISGMREAERGLENLFEKMLLISKSDIVGRAMGIDRNMFTKKEVYLTNDMINILM